LGAGIVVAVSLFASVLSVVAASPSAASVSVPRSVVEVPPLASGSVSSGSVDRVVGDFSSAPPVAGQPSRGVEGFVEGGSVRVAVSETEEVFENPDGSRTVRASAGQRRFRVGGEWREIDPSLVADEAGGWRAAATPATVRVGQPGRGLAVVTVGGAEVELDVVGAGVQASPRLGQRAEGLAGAKGVGFEVGAGHHVEVAALPSGVKTTHEISAPAEVLEVVTLPAGWSARQGDGVVELVDGAGAVGGVWSGGPVWDGAPFPAESSTSMALVGVAGQEVTARAVVDAAWLGSPERVWPVRVDPQIVLYPSGPWGVDSYVQSNILYTSQASQPVLKIGTYDGGATVRRSLITFPVQVPVGAQVLAAELDVYESDAASSSPKTWTVHRNTSAWDASTVWSNQPSFEGSPSSIVTTGAPLGWKAADVTGLVGYWHQGTYPNYGLMIKANDETDSAAAKSFYSNDSGVPPTLVITYDSAPTASSPTAPADGGIVTSRTPALASTVATDADAGDAVKYWFRVSTGPGGESGSIVANSGWLTSPSWTVPEGALEDGGTYYWHVVTTDDVLVTSGPARSFKVDLRLGDKPALPYDAQGPVKVNLTNGNLLFATGSPSVSVLGGSVGLSYSYNSQAEDRHGLSAAY
jgi:hypothetical protein